MTTLSVTTLCNHAECHCAECRNLLIVMLNDVMLNDIMLSVVGPDISLKNNLVNSGTTVVKHSPHHPKVEGLSPATAAHAGREEMVKNLKTTTWSTVVAQW
jgi:hypothetical protein